MGLNNDVNGKEETKYKHTSQEDLRDYIDHHLILDLEHFRNQE